MYYYNITGNGFTLSTTLYTLFEWRQGADKMLKRLFHKSKMPFHIFDVLRN